MILNHLSLTNFRNFARLDMDLPSGSILLVGDNAQGKTSLLESIYLLATFTSFHATSDKQLIHFLAAKERISVARIVGDFQIESGGGDEKFAEFKPHNIEVRLIQEPNGVNGTTRFRKEILLDGVKKKISEVTGFFKAVLFLPQMLRMIEGAPEERRRYLNLSISQVIPNYVDVLGNYRRALGQRNALLKRLFERNGDAAELTYWDEQLSEFGAQLIFFRIMALKSLERWAAQYHEELTHGSEVLRFNYVPSYDPYLKTKNQYALPIDTPIDRSGIALEDIREGLLEALIKLRNKEIQRGSTTIGPHRDEVRFLSNGIDLGVYGSRGQARTAVLSLKLAEVSWIKEKSGVWPVLLLDEVLAELDKKHRDDLIRNIVQANQSLITTTDIDLFEKDYVENIKQWKIEGGRIIESDADGLSRD